MDAQRLLDLARRLPEEPGVYILRDAAGVEIYVGKAKNLRRRVAGYFQEKDRLPKEMALVGRVLSFEHVVTDSELEAFLLESRLIKDLQPKYNVMLKNREGYPFLEILWGEDYPRVKTAWRKENPESRYFGPYVGVGGLRPVIAALQRIFLFRACSRELRADGEKRRRGERGCLNLHLKRCAGPCCGRIGKDEYRKRISSLCRFLSGGKKELLADLRRGMLDHAARFEFELAAAARDMISSLEKLNEQPEIDESLAPAHFRVDPAGGVAALREGLGLALPPDRIEGVDIANLMGSETVGAVASFLNGSPFKDGYRRFRIKTVDGQDDFACVAEVVRRRYGRLKEEGGPFPDVVLIDGGRGQLGAAAGAFGEVGAFPSALVGLAKAEETLFLHGRDGPILWPKRHEGLRLMMRVRDEAHRFARHYHHILRRKAVFEE